MPPPRFIAAAMLAASLSGCSALARPSSSPTPVPPTVASTLTPMPSATASQTPDGCLTAAGSVSEHALNNGKPAQQFIVYLPPCYEQSSESRYPVLYLLHGQTFNDDQWVRLGAPTAADDLIHSGEAQAFLMVFPDDRYWNLPPGESFGQRLVEDIVPYVDATFRTRAERGSRALGGLSRGGGWAIHQALTRYDLFGIIGLHSPVIFNDDAAIMDRLVPAVPESAWPKLWLDAGDRDGDLGSIRRFEEILTANNVPHEWHVYSGDHTERYWQAHVVEYLRWYVEAFDSSAGTGVQATTAP